MMDEIKHECAVALVVLRKPADATGDFGGTKLSLLLEKQHNRGQDGAGAAILSEDPVPGTPPYWIGKSASATSLADVLTLIARRNRDSAKKCRERIFLGHLRYATFGKNDVAFCHPFVHKSSCLDRTLLLAGNFNLTDNQELFDKYVALGHHPDSRADGYLLTQLMAHHLGKAIDEASSALVAKDFAKIIADTLACADGAWTLCGMTGTGWAFATRDPNGIRPCFYYTDDRVVVVASERPAIQAAFDVAPEAVKELRPGASLVVSPSGEVQMSELGSDINARPRPCSFERIYFSRANDADIHRERKALGAALVPQILAAADAPVEDIFFSYIPNSARIAFHGLLERMFETTRPRFGEVIVKDAKFRTFIADAAARREFYKHVYDVTYGLVRPGKDTLVVLDDSIVRGNTMKNAILPMLDRLGPRRIVIASSAPPIRYPDCYGIDMSTLDELVAFRALVNMLGTSAERELESALLSGENALPSLYARFTPEEHCAEIARLLTPPGLKAEVKVVFQSVDSLHAACPNDTGDWYFTGGYPTPGGYKVLHTALRHYLEKSNERSY
jgi:amidophosphoribosyltransferase